MKQLLSCLLTISYIYADSCRYWKYGRFHREMSVEHCVFVTSEQVWKREKCQMYARSTFHIGCRGYAPPVHTKRNIMVGQTVMHHGTKCAPKVPDTVINLKSCIPNLHAINIILNHYPNLVSYSCHRTKIWLSPIYFYWRILYYHHVGTWVRCSW